jgi:hypothetical protein
MPRKGTISAISDSPLAFRFFRVWKIYTTKRRARKVRIVGSWRLEGGSKGKKLFISGCKRRKSPFLPRSDGACKCLTQIDKLNELYYFKDGIPAGEGL